MVAEVISALPPRTASLLEDFCSHANRQTGVGLDKDFERFCKFAIMAHEENVQLPEEALCKYLQDHGWSNEMADSIAKRYRSALRLLSIYDRFSSGDLTF